MLERTLMRLRRWLAASRRRWPRVPRTVARNMLVLWFIVIAAVGAGAAWRLYAVDNATLLHFVRDEWRAGVDKIGAIVPQAVAFVAEQKTWVLAAMQSALPRRGAPAAPAADGREEAESAWRRGLDLATRIALGYDVTDAGAVLAAAVPGAPASRGTSSPGPTGAEPPLAAGGTPHASATNGVAPVRPPTSQSSPAADGAPSQQLQPNLRSGDPGAADSAGGGRIDANAATIADADANASAATSGSTPLIVPGPPVPTAPTMYRDEVQATFADARGRIHNSGSMTASRDQSCRVLIFHTHTSETYRTDDFTPGRPDQYHLWNSIDSGIVHVGRALTRALEDRFGVPTCHLLDIHDWPSHARAYIESRATVEEFLRRNPQVELVLDVHRDAPTGLVTTVAGQEAARVGIVVGTHPTMHPKSATNVALADHMGALIQQRHPELFRRVIDRPDARFNQDLHPHALILEIGSYDTHLDAALVTADLLAAVVADAVHALRSGTVPGIRAPR